ncbi:TPA: glycoside hydrolase [Klebsiella pneumoniae]|uniref:family 4 glycosyl hydrolase n=1 Tax=Klebsiella pneumoniae TaxID=573 RepID=UPI000353C7F3|nr:maltose-6'-phosphate glucosidase [Klebsiella pneumoniae]EPF42591.1 maltose-6'-phosphate glucosidase [Klebsiella pneumoniae subsp. pneumoniae CIP 52.145 = B5055]HDU3802481.1 glycoside hydrolase [Klebsiella pneumoniae subsp. pneumoniae]MCD9702391.1 glycoside hydrolase [Klebsiella pneumoniae]UHL85038.1 glycoside hydrolase [Klebsiella pneumoniae]UTA38353.1 glycoside hydrolase [Klebsiella pneumoniae]
MKLTVLGGGGVRSAFLAKSLAYNAHRIGLTEVVFLDNSADNLAIFGEIARYVFNTIRPDIQFSTTTDPVAALQDANYIITTLRVGGDESRIRDERIALEHNTLGQETTGAGGFAMAMRSIPAILGCEERDLSVECYGLNHFSWFTHFTVRGEEVTERLIASPELYQKTAMQYFSPELVRLCDNQLLNEYLYYYYYRDEALKAIQGAGETRGEQIARINQEMREALRTVDARTQPEAAFTIWMQHYLRRENSYMQNESRQEKFHTREPLTLRQFIEEPDTGGYAGVALDILEAVNSTTTKRIVVSIQNNGTLDFLRPDDVIEISCDLSRDGLRPVTPVKVPTAQKNMIACVKEYERLAVAAILQQDKSLAVRALMAHPLIGSYSLAKTLVEAYLDDEQFAAWR